MCVLQVKLILNLDYEDKNVEFKEYIEFSNWFIAQN